MECFCLGTISLIVAHWKCNVLKTSIFALLGKCYFQEHQTSAGQLSADSSSTETLYCKYALEMAFKRQEARVSKERAKEYCHDTKFRIKILSMMNKKW